MSKPKIARTCPTHGPTVFLIVKHRKSDGKPFLGCPLFFDKKVRCTYVEEYPLELKLREAGMAMLPGIDG